MSTDENIQRIGQTPGFSLAPDQGLRREKIRHQAQEDVASGAITEEVLHLWDDDRLPGELALSYETGHEEGANLQRQINGWLFNHLQALELLNHSPHLSELEARIEHTTTRLEREEQQRSEKVAILTGQGENTDDAEGIPYRGAEPLRIVVAEPLSEKKKNEYESEARRIRDESTGSALSRWTLLAIGVIEFFIAFWVMRDVLGMGNLEFHSRHIMDFAIVAAVAAIPAFLLVMLPHFMGPWAAQVKAVVLARAEFRRVWRPIWLMIAVGLFWGATALVLAYFRGLKMLADRIRLEGERAESRSGLGAVGNEPNEAGESGELISETVDIAWKTDVLPIFVFVIGLGVVVMVSHMYRYNPVRAAVAECNVVIAQLESELMRLRDELHSRRDKIRAQERIQQATDEAYRASRAHLPLQEAFEATVYLNEVVRAAGDPEITAAAAPLIRRAGATYDKRLQEFRSPEFERILHDVAPVSSALSSQIESEGDGE